MYLEYREKVYKLRYIKNELNNFRQKINKNKEKLKYKELEEELNIIIRKKVNEMFVVGNKNNIQHIQGK